MNRIKLSLVGAVAALSLVLGLVGPMAASAATTPSLGMATTYGVLANTYTNTIVGTTINGDVGFTTGPAVAPVGDITHYGSGAPYATAGVDQGIALAALALQPCTFTFAPGAINLSTDTTHGPIGVYAPGVYCSSGAMNVGGPLTLSGSGTYIFRPDGALTSTAGALVTLTGASACDVFWTPTQATTLAANTTFVGTVIDDAGITVGAISVPICVVPVPAPSSEQPATVNVVKRVINDNGRTKTIADFPLFVDSTPVVSGVTYTFPSISGVYTVTETEDPNYTVTFSGDCDINGQFNLTQGQNKFCIVTNDDIGAPVVVPPVPPLIDVVKVPSPLSLPTGPGAVTYTYTLRNIGTVPVTDVTMVGDTCSPISLVSGDSDSDARLDVTEIWTYHCYTTLSETHTNIVVATGWANGLTATDIASATVVVGTPIVPPLIHITKIPSPLTLLAGGGAVTYTKQVTNPGTVALSNVHVTDDKCTPTYVSGDMNGDSMLDPAETWTYTCTTNHTVTTTNTAIATGEANGLTARDFAIATVVVATAVPALPKTGFASATDASTWVVVAASIFAVALLLYVIRKKQTA